MRSRMILTKSEILYMFYLDSIIFISYVLIVIKFAAESYS